jgi:hypothetical protein
MTNEVSPVKHLLDTCGAGRPFSCAALAWNREVAQTAVAAIRAAARAKGVAFIDLDASHPRFDEIRVHATLALCDRQEWSAVAHLTRTYGSNPALIEAHVMALVTTDAREDFVAADRSLMSDIRNLPEATQISLKRARIRMPAPIPAEEARIYLDKIPGSIQQAIQLIRPAPLTPNVSDLILGLRRFRRNFGQDFDDVDTNRFLWGAHVAELTRFLVRYPRQHADRNHPWHDEIIALCDQLPAYWQAPELCDFIADQLRDRAIMVCRFHAGIPSAAQPVTAACTLSEITIAAVGQTNLTEGLRKKHLGLRKDVEPAKRFLQVIKIARKNPHVINIFPDGPRGADKITRQVGPLRLEIAQGAPSLAWNTKALTWFGRSDLSLDGRITSRLIRGPDPKDFRSREAYTEAFLDAMIEQWLQIALGPVQDIGGEGGFWNYVAKLAVNKEVKQL